jgi:hypothetical protein
MAKKIEISPIRFEQFNKMVEMLRTIRTYDVRKQVAALKRDGYTREEALELVVNMLQNIARDSRGIAELREVNHG